MEKQEKEKKAHEIANKLTETIVSECEPDEMAMVASLILKRLHDMFQTRISLSKENLQIEEDSYSKFLGNINLPLIEEAKAVKI